MPDLLVILLLTIGSVVGVGSLGLVVARLLRRHSLGWQLMVVTMLPVLAVAAALAVNVGLMFVSPHDSWVLVVALAGAVLLGLLGAWLLLRRLLRGSAELGSGVQLLLADGVRRPAAADPPPLPPLPRELEEVRRELAEARVTLAEARDRGRHAERARHELIGFLSHDLRTPLAGLRALTEGLEDGVIGDVPRAHAQLRATVARMTGLVEDLFELSRSTAPVTERDRVLVSVSELVGDVTEQQTATAAASGVQLQAVVPDEDRLAVVGDADALARALANLLANAVRHTESAGTVSISADRNGNGHIRVAVSDGCGGIPAGNLERVFDTGWRGTSARTGPGQSAGAGLGLTITHRVVQAHAGSIAVRNIAGGCCFELQLPAAPR